MGREAKSSAWISLGGRNSKTIQLSDWGLDLGDEGGGARSQSHTEAGRELAALGHWQEGVPSGRASGTYWMVICPGLPSMLLVGITLG